MKASDAEFNLIKDNIEKLIDQYRLVDVMHAIAEICHEKAVHIETNWQDNNLSRSWHNMAHKIERNTWIILDY